MTSLSVKKLSKQLTSLLADFLQSWVDNNWDEEKATLLDFYYWLRSKDEDQREKKKKNEKV